MIVVFMLGIMLVVAVITATAGAKPIGKRDINPNRR
jgi:hypothetical protein